MTGDCHVRFLESVGVKSPCATYPYRENKTSEVTCDSPFFKHGRSTIIIVRTWRWFNVERGCEMHKPSRVRFSQPPGSVWSN